MIDAPTAALLAGFAVGLGLAFHPAFFIAALIVVAFWATPHLRQLVRNRDDDVDANYGHGLHLAYRN